MLKAADFNYYSPQTRESLSCWNPDFIGFNLIQYILCNICEHERPGAILVFMIGWDDINALKEKLLTHPVLSDPNRVLLVMCHGSMDSLEQVMACLCHCLCILTKSVLIFCIIIYCLSTLMEKNAIA